MSSITKRFSVGWVAGIALGITCSTFAGSISDTFNTGDTLTAAQMTNIKNAVNDNNTKIGTLTTDVNNLKNGTPACPTGTTAVGSICVDNTRQGPSISWSDAVDTCRVANKRLLTPAEYMAAHNLGTITDMTNLEWVDAIFTNGASGSVDAGRLTVGYMGPSSGTGGTASVPAGQIFAAVNADYDDGSLNFIYFRCAR